MATYREALEDSIAYFQGDDLAAKVFVGKYALTTPDGDILERTPADMHRRLAREFARIEKKYPNPMGEDEIFGLFDRYKYVVPQGSPMAGIGNPFQLVSYSNCFVIPSPHDSYGGILYTDQQQVQIMKRRGGVGHDISNIRPRGLPTSNAAKTTDGLGVFMERFSNTTREVAQGGRRGALLLSVSVHHPEISTFINIKKDRTKVTGANISIRLSDEFMVAVRDDTDVELRWPVEAVNPVIRKMVPARDLWHEIITAAHESAEPGLLFWDTVRKHGPADIYEAFGFKTISTNPCGEITLSAYDSCRLLLLNLLSFVTNPFTPYASFDFAKFHEVTVKAQRLMDDLIDLELEAIDKILAKIEADEEPWHVKQVEYDLWKNIKEACVKGRRTGLGITALGDALAALNVRYGSDDSVAITEMIYKALAVGSYTSSCIMAGERGPFPIFNRELEQDHPFIKQVINADPMLAMLYKKYGRRNIANTTTAPAGSVSTQTQTTSGIENAFLLKYTRRKKINPNDQEARVDFVDALGDKWQEFEVYHHGFKQWMDVTGKTNPEESPYWGATSADVDWRAKIKVQAAAQKWICHSISNTTNVPKDTPVDVIKDIYMLGWELGCKGVTVYRDGCRDGVLVNGEVGKGDMLDFEEHHAPKRPESLPCDIHHVKIKGEPWTVLVGLLNGKPYEVFGGLSTKVSVPKTAREGAITKVKHRGAATYDLYWINPAAGLDNVKDSVGQIEDIAESFENPTQGSFTRTISTALRHGTPVQYIVEQLQKGDKDSDMFTFSKVMARVLKKYIKDGAKSSNEKRCLECGAQGTVVYQEGCNRCTNCGSSKCG